jgi:hypothetical protein
MLVSEPAVSYNVHNIHVNVFITILFDWRLEDKKMRTELQPLEGRRVTFTGTFIRFGVFETKRSFHRKVLLKNVKDIHGRHMAQHISLSEPSDVKVFEGFGQGEVLQFSAIVCSYVKGYHGENIELRLARPSCIDYGFREVRDLICVSCSAYRKKEVKASLMQELNSRKRISLGIC